MLHFNPKKNSTDEQFIEQLKLIVVKARLTNQSPITFFRTDFFRMRRLDGQVIPTGEMYKTSIRVAVNTKSLCGHKLLKDQL